MQPRLRRTRALSLALLAFLSVSGAEGGQTDELELVLRDDQDSFELGQPIELRIAYENHGSEAFFVERPGYSHTRGLKLKATRGECRYESSFLHSSAPIEYQRFAYIPLLVGDRFVTTLPQFNDLLGVKLMDLRVPGTYELWAVLESEGSRAEGFVWPIWRGTVESEPLSITIVEPSEETVRRWTSRLRKCLREAPCIDLEAIGYFRFVRDPEAAQVLRRLLQRDYEKNPLIAEAVANQGTAADLELLKELASKSSYESTREYFETLAATNLDDPCRKLPPEPE